MGDYQMRVEFTIKNGVVTKKEYLKVKNVPPFPPAQLNELKKLVNKYENQIVKDWISFVVKHEKVTRKVITTKIK